MWLFDHTLISVKLYYHDLCPIFHYFSASTAMWIINSYLKYFVLRILHELSTQLIEISGFQHTITMSDYLFHYQDYITHSVWYPYNAVNYLKHTNKRHPIARPLERGMGCLFGIQHLIDILPQFLQLLMQYLTILDRLKTTLDCICCLTPCPTC